MAQEKASPPRTPQCALQIVPNVIDSAKESPASRLLLRRVRIGGEEGRPTPTCGRSIVSTTCGHSTVAAVVHSAAGTGREAQVGPAALHTRARDRRDLCQQPSTHVRRSRTRTWRSTRSAIRCFCGGRSTRAVPASRGFTPWCRSRTATSSFGRQALERPTGSSSMESIGPARSTSRGRGPARLASERRIAFVFRCTRPSRYYQSAWPHRVVVPCV